MTPPDDQSPEVGGGGLTEFGERLADALAPLVAYLVENMPVIERAVAAHDDWGINRLEALANGLIDVEEA
jgi:hypothetical protein